ncbi:MAG: DUF2264 domain-containing protein [Bacteroidales bacterium]|nr:DUF2264 domain-containing protein [Candidatus Liminaster caballi]
MKKLIVLTLTVILVAMSSPSFAKKAKTAPQPTDREVWTALLYRMSQPILEPMSEGRLQQVMTYENGNLEVSPTWDGRNKKVAYMEAFARLMAGLAPWLSLPDDDTDESLKRKQLRTWALGAYRHAVDPQSPDYLGWTSGGQTLVDAAYLVESFHRGWEALWVPLDLTTKLRYISELQQLHRYDPPYQNWFLFCGMEEAFLLKASYDKDVRDALRNPSALNADQQALVARIDQPIQDAFRIKTAVNKAEEWYIGDGWYADGPSFAFDYYNSYVIQPMYAEILEMVCDVQPNNSYLVHSLDQNYRTLGPKERLAEVRKRMQKYSCILERFVSPEGTYPVYGRSIPYRLAVFQPLAMLAWQHRLPEQLPNGQVRAAMTAVMKRMYKSDIETIFSGSPSDDTPTNFNPAGFLTIGFCGSHPNVADIYTNNGSLYMTSLAFLPLGLPADDPFWTDAPLPWTSKKAWEGQDFPKDHKWHINPQILYWE